MLFSYFKILRVAIDDEEIGMDIIKHGEAAYPVAAWREYQYRCGHITPSSVTEVSQYIVRIHGGGEQTESTSNPKVLRKYDSQVSMVSSALASLGGGANNSEASKIEMESKGEKS